MKQKQLTLALWGALALPLPCLADSSNVVVYGKLEAAFDNVRQRDGTPAGTPAPVGLGLGALNAPFYPAGAIGAADVLSRNRVSSYISHLGFRGAEDLGNGLKAIWQIETLINIDSGSGGALASGRNNNVGLTGSWGTAFLGIWDTPFKFLMYLVDPSRGVGGFANYGSIFGTPGLNIGSAAVSNGPGGSGFDGGFDRREGNSVAYWTPDFNGLSARFQMNANEGKTATSDPRLYSASVTYNKGPLLVAYGYERHDDYFGLRAASPVALTASASKDIGHRLAAAYAFGNTRVSAAWERLEYETSGQPAPTAAVNRLERDAWLIGINHRMGDNQLAAGYIKASDPECSLANGGACSGNGFGATHYFLQFVHSLSKRTEAYINWSQIRNDTYANYNFFTPYSLGGSTVGGKYTGASLGLRHIF